MPIIMTILSLIGGAITPLANWIQRKQELQAAALEAKQRIELQLLKNEGQVEAAEAHNSGERLKATSSTFKYITFGMWFCPFVLGQIRPAYAKIIFDNLSFMPAWYAQSCVIIMFAIWGISVASPVVSTVFSSLGSFFQERRDHKERIAAINRGAVFDSLRGSIKGGLSQQTVDLVNKALDAGEDK